MPSPAPDRWEAGRAAVERLRKWGGDQLVREMSALFLADMPAQLAALRAGLRTGDNAAIARAMHSMKSSCGQIGAVAMQRLCQDAEIEASRDDLTRLPSILQQLEAEFSEFRGWLVSVAEER